MDMNDDVNLIDDLLLVHNHLTDDAMLPSDVANAWQRVWRWWCSRVAAPPPAPMGGAYDGTAHLAEHLYKMGLAGGLPTKNSEGFEALLLRWVIVAEQMGNLLTAIVEPGATAMGASGGEGADGDYYDYYQPDFCDDCGTQLTAKGFCLICDKDVVF